MREQQYTLTGRLWRLRSRIHPLAARREKPALSVAYALNATMKDLTDTRWIKIKGVLFLFVGLLAAALLLVEHPEIRTAALLSIAVWCFCRFYYFAFYVIQHYVDPSYRFSGLWSAARYLIAHRRDRRSSSKFLLTIIGLIIFTAVLSVWAYRAGAMPFNAGYCPATGDAAVTNFLVPIRNRHEVPAMAAALVTSKGLVAVGAVGTRKRGTETAVTLNDQWHLGSDGKAMTATLVAKLVEQHRLRWDSTLGEIFPDLAPGFSAEARTITILQLLSHHSGLKPNPDLADYRGAEGTKERLRLVKNELSQPLMHKPGAQLEYSNLGYAIVGAVIEKVTGKTWEQAMRDEVFGPLGMTSVGFGGTGTPGVVDQPWGHYENGKPVPDNGPGMDNPPVLSPAGRIHCTIQDWGKFIADQLRGDRGEPALLKPASYKTLHTPPCGGEYALGWAEWRRPWGGGKVLNHCGDNTMNFANVWVAPLRDFAVLCCVNQSGETAFKASDEAITALISLHVRKQSASSGSN
jgi:CubicO group peptidase (beta-lactamase class C family)